jgi:hypothetical protein
MTFSARADEHSILKLGVFRNRALVISICIAIPLQVAVVLKSKKAKSAQERNTEPKLPVSRDP